MNETETAGATPEQLLKMLDARMVMQRAQRGDAGRNRFMFLVGGVLFIVIGAGVAFVVLSQMVSDLQQGGRQPEAQSSQQSSAGNF